MHHSHEIKGALRPLQDWVVLRPVKEPERVRGGIVLPDKVEDFGRCEVMAVGPGYRPNSHGIYSSAFIPTELKVGQFVYVQKFVDGELRIKLNGDACYLIRERHLSLTVEEVSA